MRQRRLYFKWMSYLLWGYKFEILSAFISAILVTSSSWLVTNRPWNVLLSWFIIFAGLIITLILLNRSRDFYYIPFTRLADGNKWFGQGILSFEKAHSSYAVSGTEAGFIFAPCLTWDDYSLTFDFKIIKSCLGIIVRASSLSNYVMFQVTKEGIRPHLRVNGGWKAYEIEETGLRFDKLLSLERWYSAKITCEKNMFNLAFLDKEEVILDRQWILKEESVAATFKSESTESITIFPVNADYGSIGFRNYDQEKALIRNLLIQK